MTFSYVKIDETIASNKRIVWGTFTSGTVTDTGGDIVTGLNRVESFLCQPTGATTASQTVVVNETIPLESGTVTILSDAGVSGVWYAVGQ